MYNHSSLDCYRATRSKFFNSVSRKWCALLVKKNSLSSTRNIRVWYIFTMATPAIGEKDMAQGLECAALLMSLPAVRFESRLVQDFQGNIMFLLSYIGTFFDVVSLGNALSPQMLHLTQIKMSRQVNRCSDQGVNIYKSRMKILISD